MKVNKPKSVNKYLNISVFVLLFIFQILLLVYKKPLFLYMAVMGASLFFLYLIIPKVLPKLEENIKKSAVKKIKTILKTDHDLIITIFAFTILVVCIVFFVFGKMPIVLVQYAIIILGAGLAFLLNRPATQAVGKNVFFKGWGNLDAIILPLITAAALISRFVMLGSYPQGVNSDEMLFIQKAAPMLSGGTITDAFVGDAEQQFGSPIYFLISFFLKIFGVNLFGLRAVNALFAVMAIVSFYIFLRLFFSSFIATIASVIYLTDHVFLHVSRWMSIPAMSSFFVWAILIFACLGYMKRNYGFFIAAGLITGWGMFFYNSNKFLPVILIFYFIYEFVAEKSLIREKLKFHIWGIVTFFLSFIIAFMPLMLYAIQNFKSYSAHIQWVSIPVAQAIKNIGVYIGMFTFKGTENVWMNYAGNPLFSAIPAILFLAGFGFVILQVKRRESFLALVLLIGGLIPGIFSSYWSHPNNNRTITALSASFLIIAIALDNLYSSVRLTPKKILGIFLCILATASCVFELNIYFNMMRNDRDIVTAFSPLEFNIQKICNESIPKKDVFVSQYFFGGPMGSMPFMGEGMYFYNGKRPFILEAAKHSVDSLLLFPFNGKDVTLIEESFWENMGDFIKKRFPNVEVVVKKSQIQYKPNVSVLAPDMYDPSVSYVVFNIPAKDIDDYTGLKYYGKDGEGTGTRIMLDGKGEELNSGTAIGSIRIFKSGDYSFYIEGAPQAGIFINGSKVKNGQYIKLFEGIYSFKVIFEKLTGKEILYISKGLSQKAGSVIYGELVNEKRNGGFKGKYFMSSQGKEELVREETIPFIHNKWYFKALNGRDWQRKMTVEWKGKIKIETEGNYSFGIEGQGQDSVLHVDGKKVFSAGWLDPSKRSPDIKKVNLKKGIHSIELSISQYSVGLCTELYMINPDGKKIEPLPEEMVN
ncbi:MAG: glycosyltransferase family 39 protein [bacterium]